MQPLPNFPFAIFLLALLCPLAAGWAVPALGQAESEPAKPVFQDGQAQPVEAFSDADQWIRHDLWVETEFNTDGDDRPDRVHVCVTRQRQTETEGLKVPVIYETSPYYSGTNGARDLFWDPNQELGSEPPERTVAEHIPQQSRRPVLSNTHVNTWVPRGFAVVHSASPGTGLSQGCPTVGGKNESLAPKAVIDWLCGRAKGYTTPDGDEEVTAEWCTGKVGMTGTSYNGTLPLAAATTGVEGLMCIIPIAPNTSYYHYYRSYGLIRHPGGYMGEDIDVLYDFINSGDPEKRDYCDCEVRDEEMHEGFDRVSGDYNEFWAGRDYLNQLDNVKAAVLMAHAFNDWNVMPEHSVRIYEALKAKGLPVRCYFHQGGHGGQPPIDHMNRWFTRYLYDVENDVESDPRSWVVREGDRRNKPTAYADYPHPEAQPVKLYPTRGGNQRGGLVVSDPMNRDQGPRGQGQEKVVDDASVTGADMAMADESKHRLLFTTAELQEDLHLSGYSTMRIRLACDKPAANLSVWMVSLPWDPEADRGRVYDNIITRGWADPQNHKSLTESEPLEPGKFYDLTFRLQPDDQVIPKGQQIGLMIFSSDHDFTLWPEPGTELTVDLDQTSIEIQVVGGLEKFKSATGN